MGINHCHSVRPFFMLLPGSKFPSGVKQSFELCLFCYIFYLAHEKCFNKTVSLFFLRVNILRIFLVSSKGLEKASEHS